MSLYQIFLLYILPIIPIVIIAYVSNKVTRRKKRNLVKLLEAKNKAYQEQQELIV